MPLWFASMLKPNHCWIKCEHPATTIILRCDIAQYWDGTFAGRWIWRYYNLEKQCHFGF